MKHTLRKPCNDCPYRKNALPGWTGQADPEWFVDSALSDAALYQGGATFAPCHKTVDYSSPTWEDDLGDSEVCFGALRFAANCCKSPRDPERSAAVRAAGRGDDVFSSPQEFLDHHKTGGE